MTGSHFLQKKLLAATVFILCAGFFLASPAHSLTSEELIAYWGARYASILSRPTSPSLPDFLLAEAQPDECFFDVGHPSNSYNPFLYLNTSTCTNAAGTLKKNQAYVWGMAKSGEDIWFGTMSNTHCLVIGGYLGSTTPVLTDSYVCEFGESAFSPPVPAIIGDWRPPRIFVYDTANNTPPNPKEVYSNCPAPASTTAEADFVREDR